MFEKKDYVDSYPLIAELKEKVKKDTYRLGYHIMPPTGWLNDPNGLCQLKGVNHLYFQYTPHVATWGIKLWGHYTTKDWITYQALAPFLFPDTKNDQDGVYSGSAFIENEKLYFFYTGNVKYEDKNYNYITDGREQNTLLTISGDGLNHDDKRLVLKNEDYPKDMSQHVRDPKIYKKDGRYYMVLGARTKLDTGCALLYVSDDLLDWKYHMRIETETPFGYMWECPDLFDLDGKTVLICCPQGVNQNGIDFANVYQCGYFEIKLDLQTKSYQLSSFIELDRGFDIYAPQSFEDEKGRRILIAWMGLPDANYLSDANGMNGWQHALTMPRELKINGNKILQQPLVEFEKLRQKEKELSFKDQADIAVSLMYECNLIFDTCNTLQMTLRDDIQLIFKDNLLTLIMGESGCGRTVRSVAISNLYQLQIFMDTSSIEIFINEGIEVFTTRYYSKYSSDISMLGSFEVKGKLYELQGFMIEN